MSPEILNLPKDEKTSNCMIKLNKTLNHIIYCGNARLQKEFIRIIQV